MKIIHTSDWHLDHSLYHRRRTEEFSAFLAWMLQTLAENNADVLVISGDIFNTRTPSVQAQEMYYDFLKRVRKDYVQGKSRCRHVVIVAGNHDSPAFLAAPREVLEFLEVYVITGVERNVLFLKNREETEAVLVAAVPFLPAREVTVSKDGETAEEKSRNLNLGIRDVYHELLAEARRVAAEFGAENVPIITTGHLFTQGGKTGDETHSSGFRELYVGSLEHFPADGFPDDFDYVALGHLHVPQRVAGREHVRYSGSPIPIDFSEAGGGKEVVLVEFLGSRRPPGGGELPKDARPASLPPGGRQLPSAPFPAAITRVPVPCFQELRRIRGGLDEIQSEIQILKMADSEAWLEVVYDGAEYVADLERKIAEWVKDSRLEVLGIRNRSAGRTMQGVFREDETLEHLDEENVFVRRLEQKNVLESQHEDLLEMFREIVRSL